MNNLAILSPPADHAVLKPIPAICRVERDWRRLVGNQRDSGGDRQHGQNG